jgi:hypothetical protein
MIQFYPPSPKKCLVPTQSPVHWVPEDLSQGIKRKADFPPPSSAGDKNEWSYASTPSIERDNFTFLSLGHAGVAQSVQWPDYQLNDV